MSYTNTTTTKFESIKYGLFVLLDMFILIVDCVIAVLNLLCLVFNMTISFCRFMFLFEFVYVCYLSIPFYVPSFITNTEQRSWWFPCKKSNTVVPEK